GPEGGGIGRIDIGAGDDGDGLALAVDRRGGVPERQNIVDGGEIKWSHSVAGAFARGANVCSVPRRRRSQLFGFFGIRPDGDLRWLLQEVVQRIHSRDDRGERGRDGRIADVGQVLLSVDEVLVNRRPESLLDLSGGTGELYDGAAVADLRDLEAAGLQPVGHSGDVGIGGAELGAEFHRGQPLLITWRFLVLLIFNEA